MGDRLLTGRSNSLNRARLRTALHSWRPALYAVLKRPNWGQHIHHELEDLIKRAPK